MRAGAETAADEGGLSGEVGGTDFRQGGGQARVVLLGDEVAMVVLMGRGVG